MAELFYDLLSEEEDNINPEDYMKDLNDEDVDDRVITQQSDENGDVTEEVDDEYFQSMF